MSMSRPCAAGGERRPDAECGNEIRAYAWLSAEQTICSAQGQGPLSRSDRWVDAADGFPATRGTRVSRQAAGCT
jgi:hypothetical protein